MAPTLLDFDDVGDPSVPVDPLTLPLPLPLPLVVLPDVSGSLEPSPPDAEPEPLEDSPVPIPPVMLATRDGVENW